MQSRSSKTSVEAEKLKSLDLVRGNDFVPVGDFCGFSKHRGNRTIFRFAQLDCVAHSFVVKLAREPVEDFDFRPNLGRVRRIFARDAYFELPKVLPFFSQD